MDCVIRDAASGKELARFSMDDMQAGVELPSTTKPVTLNLEMPFELPVAVEPLRLYDVVKKDGEMHISPVRL